MSIDQVTQAVQHEYLLAVYGVVVYFAILFSLSKDKYDSAHKRFKFKEWWRRHNDNLLVTLMIVPLVVVFDDEIIGLVNAHTEKDIQMGRMVYLLAGPITNLLYKAITKLRRNGH